MKHPTTSFANIIERLTKLHPKSPFLSKSSHLFFVPEKRIIFAKVQRRKRSKIGLLYHLSFKLLVINWSNMLHLVSSFGVI